MATAPTPGTTNTPAAERAEAAAGVVIMTLWPNMPDPDERTRTLNPAAIPFKERLICRKATGGMPFEAFMIDQESGMQAVGLDTVMVWWWLAGRRDNPLLTLDKSNEDFPDVIGEDVIDVKLTTAEDDDPES